MSSRKQIATSFLQLASAGDVQRAFQHTAAGFRHHNAYFRGDAQSLAEAMAQNAAQHPDKHLQIERAIEEGDLVAIHSRVRLKADMPEIALVHIFRFEGESIAELWDIGQPVPDHSPNEYGMF